MTVAPPFGREAIEELLPHREPFLLIDEVLELTPGVGAVARKTVRDDAWCLAGHFPGAVAIKGRRAGGAQTVLANDEPSALVQPSDEWFMARPGIRERRIAAPEEALTDLALPAARGALAQAQVVARDVDLLVCATVTP